MWRYIVRRLLWVVVVVLIITAFTYVIFFVMPPTDPAVQFAGRSPTPELIAEVRRQFGLDKPIWAQYGLFLKHTFTGDEYGWPGLGFSFVTRASVRDMLLDRLPVTVQLAVGAALVWLCIGIPIGIVSGIRRRSLIDRASMLLALFFVSAPGFWLGMVALWLFWSKLGVSPGTGYVPMGKSFGDWLSHMILPWVVLALLFAAQYARMTRGNLIENDGAGLHPDGAGQGAAGVEGDPQARRAGQPDPGGDADRPGPGGAAGRRGDHRDGLQPPGHRPVGGRLGVPR
jgi:peptide/nickel transport system permease protein